MTERIVFAGGPSFDCPVQEESPVMDWPRGREWKKIRVLSTMDAVKAIFVDGAAYKRQWESKTGVDGLDQPVYETMTEDLSAYSVAGDIVDHRGGIITVFMGKPTETELLQEALDALVLETLGGAV